MPLQSRLPQIAATLEAAARTAAAHGAEKVANTAKARVPVRTGRLRDRIHTQTDRDGSYVIAGDNEAFYGAFQEFGTTRHPPRPFLVPALEENTGEILRRVREAIRGL